VLGETCWLSVQSIRFTFTSVTVSIFEQRYRLGILESRTDFGSSIESQGCLARIAAIIGGRYRYVWNYIITLGFVDQAV